MPGKHNITCIRQVSRNPVLWAESVGSIYLQKHIKILAGVYLLFSRFPGPKIALKSLEFHRNHQKSIKITKNGPKLIQTEYLGLLEVPVCFCDQCKPRDPCNYSNMIFTDSTTSALLHTPRSESGEGKFRENLQNFMKNGPKLIHAQYL